MKRTWVRSLLACGCSFLGVAAGALAAEAAATTELVWNGDDKTGWQGWVNPKKDCSVGTKQGAGRNGTAGLSFVGKGKNWIGCGWNLFGWSPDSGVDVTPYKSLVFWVKVENGVDPEGLTVNLSSSGGTGEKKGNQVTIVKYCMDYADGEWHEVVIPLSDILDKAKGLDPKTVWEIDVGTWSAEERSFTVLLDDFGLRK